MNEKGHVLAQTLLLGIIVGLIATGLVQMVLLRHTAAQRALDGAMKKKEAEGRLNELLSHWSVPGSGVCASVAGYSCTGTTGTCGCSCSRGGYSITTVAYTPPSGIPECQLSITTAD